jgi:hypothetical protein
MKHGLLAAGITELDDSEGYSMTLRDLRQEKEPVGVIEEFLVALIALNIVRRKRVARLEAEHITGLLNPEIRTGQPTYDLGEIHDGTVVDVGLPALLKGADVQILFTLYQRYATAIEQEIYRALHELERVQRMRRGEHLPAPSAVDVTVSTDQDKTVESTRNKVVLEGSSSTQSDKSGEPDSGTNAGKDEVSDPPVDPPEEQ